MAYNENEYEHYTCITDGKETESDETEYRELLKEYGKNQIIHFSYGADGCINEII